MRLDLTQEAVKCLARLVVVVEKLRGLPEKTALGDVTLSDLAQKFRDLFVDLTVQGPRDVGPFEVRLPRSASKAKGRAFRQGTSPLLTARLPCAALLSHSATGLNTGGSVATVD